MADGIPSLGRLSPSLLPLPLSPFSHSPPPTHIYRRPRTGRRCRQSEELVDIGSDIGTRAWRRGPSSFRYRKRSSSFCSRSIPCFDPAPSPAACRYLCCWRFCWECCCSYWHFYCSNVIVSLFFELSICIVITQPRCAVLFLVWINTKAISNFVALLLYCTVSNI